MLSAVIFKIGKTSFDDKLSRYSLSSLHTYFYMANTISDKQIVEVQNRLNNRPRKVLGYKTPAEVFFGTITQTYSAVEPVVALSGWMGGKLKRKQMVRRARLELARRNGTAPSRQRVYRFHHLRTEQ